MSLNIKREEHGDLRKAQGEMSGQTNGFYPQSFINHNRVPPDEIPIDRSASERGEGLPSGYHIVNINATSIGASQATGLDHGRPTMLNIITTPSKNIPCPWTIPEEELLLQIYKQNAGRLRRKGKRGQTLWEFITDTLNERCRKTGITRDDRCVQKVKDKFFNLSKKYKLAKNRKDFAGIDFNESCAHLRVFEEFSRSRDSWSPPKLVFEGSEDVTEGVIEDGAGMHCVHSDSVVVSPQSTSPRAFSPTEASPRAVIRTEESDNSVSELDEVETNTLPVRSAKRLRADESTEDEDQAFESPSAVPHTEPHSKRERRSSGDDSSDNERWFALLERQTELMQQSQRREEELIKLMQESDRNFNELFIGAIRELGTLLKKN